MSMRASSMSCAAVVLLVGVACERKAVTDPAVCAARVESYVAWATALSREPKAGARGPGPSVRLAKHQDGPVELLQEPSGVFTVRRDAILFLDQPVVQKEDSREEAVGKVVSELVPILRRQEKIRRAAGRPLDRPPFAIFVDVEAPWYLVVSLADGLGQAGLADATLFFARDVAVEPPGPSSIDGELDEIFRLPSAERGFRMKALLDRLVAPCPALASAMAGSSPAGEGLRTVGECACSLDVGALMAFGWRAVDPALVTLEMIRLAAPGAESAVEVAAPAGARWGETYRALLDAAHGNPAGGVRLVVR